MSSNTKKLIILTIVLLALSGLLKLVFGSSQFSFGLFGKKGIAGKENAWTVSENFSDIEIDSIISDVRLYPSAGRTAKVTWSGSGNLRLSVENDRGKLKITESYKRPWFLRFGVNFGKTEIAVYLPEKDYRDLDIDSDTGTITVPSGFSFKKAELETDVGNVDFRSAVKGKLEVKTSVGRISLSDISCAEISLKSDVGSIHLSNVKASGEMKIKSNVGSVELDRCDGGEIEIKTDTGSVKGTLLSGKTFDAKSDIGKVNVPDTAGAPCKIETDTGSINIEIAGR